MNTLASRYREFRSHGHGRLISVMHAPPFEILLITAVIVGVAIGLS